MSIFRRPKPGERVEQGRRSSNQIRSPSNSAPEITLQPEEQLPTAVVERSVYDIPLERPNPEALEICDSRCWLKKNLQIPDHNPLQVVQPSSEDFVVICEDKGSRPIYRSLTEWQTRLVILHPGSDQQPLSCSLVETDIIDKNGFGISGTQKVVAYEALSYSRGQGACDHLIICNGQPLSIPAQAALALLYLRSTTQERRIWCDAICIDQKNLDEKAIQVKSMFRIFEKAERVIAWLGTPLPECSRLISALDVGCDFSLPRLWYWFSHDPHCTHVAYEIGAVLIDLFARQWFRRTWVRQEVYAATDLKLQIGPHMVDFREFLQKAQYVDKSLRLVFSEVPNIGWPPTLTVYDKEYQHAGISQTEFKHDELISYSGYWRQILLDGAQFQVTDERDRVYGALGILMNRHVRFITRAPFNIESLSERFPVSYTKTTSDVFQDVIKFLINAVRELEIFDYFPAHHWYSYRRIDGMPSWTINWAKESAHAGFHRPFRWARDDFVKVLHQDYSFKDKLCLEGMTIVRQLTRLDGLKEIAFSNGQSIRMGDPLPVQHRQSSGLNGEAFHVGILPSAFVFSYVGETSSSYEIINQVVSWKDMDQDFAHHLAGDEFIFGSTEDYPDDSSLGMQGIKFLLPRETMLDDILVSLYGSKCIHLLRPLSNIENDGLRCQYIAPVVGFVVGQNWIDRCSVSKTILKRDLVASGSKRGRKMFELV